MGYYANPSVIFFLILCVQALRHCETYMGKKLIMNWYTGAKVKPGQTDDSNYQDEEAADPEVEVSYTQRDLERTHISITGLITGPTNKLIICIIPKLM